MKSTRPLSVIPYYGGKAKMSAFLAERFDYSVSTFVTLFGGGCRELLNKPPHAVEIYNEYNGGLCVLMKTLSNPDTAQELIDKLYNETEYTEEQFQKAKAIYDLYRNDADEILKERLKKFLCDNTKIKSLNKKIDAIYDFVYKFPKTRITTKVCKKCVRGEKTSSIIKVAEKQIFNMDSEKEGYAEFHILLIKWLYIKHQMETIGIMRYEDLLDQYEFTELDIAVATYLAHTFSYSGLGNHFGKDKFKTEEEYKKHILNLWKCADRLKGVHVTQLDAMSFFRQGLYKRNVDSLIKELEIRNDALESAMKDKDKLNDDQIKELENDLQKLDTDIVQTDTYIKYISKLSLYQWLNNSDIMMYLDPSYLPAIDDEEAEKDAEVSKKAKTPENKKNLGAKAYAKSSTYEEHEELLKAIQNAKCKLMISNYDCKLYNQYLTPEKGWHKEIYVTTTSVFSASKTDKSKKRIEVIWRNY